MTTILEYAQTHGIYWLPCLISPTTQSDGTIKKNFSAGDAKHILGYTPKYDELKRLLKVDKAIVQERMDKFIKNYDNYCDHAKELDDNAYWVLGLNTEDYHVIDVDHMHAFEAVRRLGWLDTMPYYVSTTKKMPKIFFTPLQHVSDLECLKFCDEKVEIQKGVWTFCDVDTMVYNPMVPPVFNMEVSMSILSKELGYEYQPIKRDKSTPSVRRTSFASSPGLLNAPVIDTHVPVVLYNTSIAWRLLLCLSDGRASDRMDWFKTGCALKSTQHPYAYVMWRLFSSRCPDKYRSDNYEVGGCDYNTWMSIRNTKTTLGTIHYWAKEDNPTLYAQNFPKNYETLRDIFHLHHFKVKNPIMFYEEGKNGELIERKRKELIDTYENMYYEEINRKGNNFVIKRVPFITTWLRDENQRTYSRIVFSPSNDHNSDEYNRFKGWRVNELMLPTYRQELVDDVLTLISTKLCDNDMDFYKYLLQWYAHILQRPGERTRVCPIIKSVQGIGKNMVSDFIGKKILGSRYYLATATSSDIIGNFNGQMEDKILIIWDETAQKETWEMMGRIKELITNDTITVQKKYVNSCTMTNRINIMSFTNVGCPFLIEHTDRRFCGIETKASPLNADEIDHYVRILQDDDTAYSFYQYLLGVDLEGVNLEKCRPMTQFYQECKSVSVPPLLTFLGWYVQQQENKDHSIQVSHLYDEFYKVWSTTYNNGKNAYSLKKFSMDICKVEGVCKKRSRTNGKDTSVVEFSHDILVSYLIKTKAMDDVSELPTSSLSLLRQQRVS